MAFDYLVKAAFKNRYEPGLSAAYCVDQSAKTVADRYDFEGL